MNFHIPTIFLSIIIVSVVLACTFALERHRHKPELMLWLYAFVLHSLVYGLFSLRGQISNFLSIIVANVLVSSLFAIVTEGLLKFFKCHLHRAIIWSPVLLTAILFTFFEDDLQPRYISGGLIFSLQALLLLYFLTQNRFKIRGHGKYLVMVSILLYLSVTSVRMVVAVSENFELLAFSASNLINTVYFVTVLICTILTVIGLLLMTWERDEQLIKASEIRLRTLFENTSDTVLILDNNSSILDCNTAALKMFGCPSKQTFLSTNLVDLYPSKQSNAGDSIKLEKQHITKAIQESSHRYEWTYWNMVTRKTFPAEVLMNSMYIQGQLVLQAVIRDISERKQLQLELERQAHLDYLTGLFTRGYFMTVAEAELVRAIRYKTSISLLMIDIDYFKKINDSNGHKAGDTVLRKLAEIFHCTLRKVDHAGRWGGEEFTIMLPETDINQAKEVAERLRELVYATQIEIERGINITFTISVGVSTLTPENQDLEHLLNMADKALYVAKESGRNQVVTYNKPFGSEFSESLTQSM